MATLLLRQNTHQLTVLVQLTVNYQRKQQQDSRQELDTENGFIGERIRPGSSKVVLGEKTLAWM